MLALGVRMDDLLAQLTWGEREEGGGGGKQPHLRCAELYSYHSLLYDIHLHTIFMTFRSLPTVCNKQAAKPDLAELGYGSKSWKVGL